MNNFKDITDYAGLSKSVLNYMDVLKILKIFGEIRDIKKEIAIFYLKKEEYFFLPPHFFGNFFHQCKLRPLFFFRQFIANLTGCESTLRT